MLKLREYQQNGVDGIRETYQNGSESTIYVLPTGGGKTVVFTYIANATQLNGKRVWILVHRVELLRQTSRALAKFKVEHGLINPKYTPDFKANVQVASVQTLVNKLDRLERPDLIIIDEAHHATAGTWRKIIEHCPQSRILGVSATPTRADGKGLGANYGGLFDSMVIGPQIYDLIEMGFLVSPIVYAPKTKIDFSSVKIVRGDFDKKQVSEIMDKPTITGDAVDHYSRICPGEPCVVFCVNIEHAKHVAEEFRSAGYRAFSVDGKMNDDDRNRILNGLADGTSQVVTSCDLISEGTDIPSIVCAIMLRPTQSTGLYIQQGGRALRLAEGKEVAYILDHVGNTFVHGMLDSHRDWTLEGRKKTKRKKKDEEDDLKVQQCEECYACFNPAPICPICGHVKKVKPKEIEKVDGELQEITTEKSKELEEKKRKQIEVWNAQTFEDLKRIEKERGYKNGWAYMKWKSRKILK